MKFAGQYNVKSFKVYQSADTGLDLGGVFIDLSIYENIFSQSLSVRATIVDTHDFVTLIPIIGQESVELEIEMATDSEEAPIDPIKLDLVIYNITNIERDGETLTYVLDMTTKDFIENFEKRVCTGHRKESSSSIVKKIFKELGSEKELNITASDDSQTLVVPNMTPFRAINWLKNKSFSNNYSAPYYFFETANEYRFKPLLEMAESDYVKEYTKTVPNTGNPAEEELKIINYTVISKFSVLDNITSGMYAAKARTVDLIGRTYDQFGHNYWDNNYSPKLAENKLQASKAYNYSPKNEYLLPENYLNPYQQDKFYLQSKSNEQIFKNFKIKVDVFGDSRVSSGDVIRLVFPEASLPEGELGPREDKNYSGNWLIVAIKHTFQKRGYTMTVELVKDGSGVSYG
jgi:hypothetical protein